MFVICNCFIYLFVFSGWQDNTLARWVNGNPREIIFSIDKFDPIKESELLLTSLNNLIKVLFRHEEYYCNQVSCIVNNLFMSGCQPLMDSAFTFIFFCDNCDKFKNQLLKKIYETNTIQMMIQNIHTFTYSNYEQLIILK
jgi:hypothetical protein